MNLIQETISGLESFTRVLVHRDTAASFLVWTWQMLVYTDDEALSRLRVWIRWSDQ